MIIRNILQFTGSKTVIKEEKQKMQTDSGHKIRNYFKTATRDAYRTVKTMRSPKENYDLINDKDRSQISNNQEELNK